MRVAVSGQAMKAARDNARKEGVRSTPGGTGWSRLHIKAGRDGGGSATW
ncbi:hypothetical protein WME88_56255 [Sorangium sp. So ce216]